MKIGSTSSITHHITDNRGEEDGMEKPWKSHFRSISRKA